MNTALMVVVGAVAFAVGFAIKGSSSHKAGNPTDAQDRNNHRFTFKGFLTVYENDEADDNEKDKKKLYKKRPKKNIKVLYKKVGDGPDDQWGSVTFENKTGKAVRIEFAADSPFTAGRAPQTFPVGPRGSSGPHRLMREPASKNKEDSYDFTVEIEHAPDDWVTLDPGVKVRRG